MPILAVVIAIIQFCFAYHVLKSGRPYWWIFIIMGFPVMGCVIYYFVEVFPGSREQRRANKAARALARALEPDADLKKRAEELEICGSVDNKLALARELTSHQMFPEALRLYESCLAGTYANDGAILLGATKAAVEAGDWSKAQGLLARLKSASGKARAHEIRLLEARVHEGRGENDAAVAAYREVLPVFVGLEARYRYGRLLLRLGKHDAAMEMFNDVLRHAGRYASSIEEEEHWADAARQAIAGN